MSLSSVARVSVSILEDESGADRDDGEKDCVFFEVHVEDSYVEGEGDNSSEEGVEKEGDLFFGSDFVGGHIGVQKEVVFFILVLHHLESIQ